MRPRHDRRRCLIAVALTVMVLLVAPTSATAHYRSHHDARDTRGGIEASRGDETLRVRFPRSWLDATRHLRWRVETTFIADGTYVDAAPCVGWYEH